MEIRFSMMKDRFPGKTKIHWSIQGLVYTFKVRQRMVCMCVLVRIFFPLDMGSLMV